MKSISLIVPDTAAGSTFAEYVRTNRFRGIGVIERIERELAACRSEAPHPSKIVLLHGPYPDEVEEGEIEFNALEEPRNLSTGQGCGKSDLLALLAERLGKYNDCYVVTFLNNRDEVTEVVHFYKDIFLDKLASVDPTLIHSTWHHLARAADFAFALLQRISLLIYAAVPVLATVVAYILTLLGFKAVEFFVDPQHKHVLLEVFTWFNRHQVWLSGVAVVGFTFWILYAWATLQRDEKLLSRWQEVRQRSSRTERVSAAKEKLASDPDQILDRFAGRGRTFVLLVDDADVLDGYSFDKLLDLYERASQSNKWSLLLALGYNPRNPTLYQTDKLAIRRELDLVRVKEQGWVAIRLEPPTPEHLRTWLWGYYHHARATELLNVLEKAFSQVRNNPGLVLSFLVFLDRRYGDTKPIIELDDQKVKQEFERYLARDRRIAQEIISAISREESAEGCLEMLKYILAFRRPKVRVQHVKAIMTQTAYKDVDAYERILLSDPVNLLRRTYDAGVRAYEFRYPYLRSMLEAGWKHWRDNAEGYHTEVFLYLHQSTGMNEDPKLALRVTPSKLAIEVLYLEGEYYYHNYGASDASYALRFYGLERGGALAKWLRLCEDATESQGWDLIQWKSEARLDPFRYLRRPRPRRPDQFFAPDLVLIAGRLYWMTGQWETADYIWGQRWPRILNKLPSASVSELAQRVREADAQIQAARAEMLYAVGQPQAWNQTNELCLALRDRVLPGSQISGKINLVQTLVRHYRAVGVGNDLPPYRFLRPDTKLDSLRQVSKLIPITELDRLRSLHLLADSLWQVLLPAPYVLPFAMDMDKIESPDVDSVLFEQFEVVLGDEKKVLKAIREYLKSHKPGTLRHRRLKEGDLLFWEGILMLMCVRRIRLRSWQEFGKYGRILGTRKRSEVQQRFDTYYALATLMNDLCKADALDRKPSTRYKDLMSGLEEMTIRVASGHVDAAQQEKEARNITQELYKEAWSSIAEQAKQRLRMAETIYRHLGYQQGIAGSAFARALADYETSDSSSFGERPSWIDGFERFFHWSSGELGFHLDTLRAHIIVARWSSERDLYRAVQEFQSADIWASYDRIGLPKAYTGEINFQIGRIIGSMEAAPFPDDYVFDVLNKAARNLDELGANLSYVQEREITHRQLNIHWWLAELSRRQAQGERNPALREKSLAHV